MKTLIIYDNTGYIIQQITGSNVREPQGGVQFIWAIIPEGKRLVSIDTTKTPHEAVLEDIPKTEMQLAQERIASLEQSNAELTTLIATMTAPTV